MKFRLSFFVPAIVRHVLLASSCLSVLSVIIVGGAKPANAWFKVCNQSTQSIDVAFAYPQGNGWTTKGWWVLGSGDCKVVYSPPLEYVEYYVLGEGHAGGFWGGDRSFCVINRKFNIGVADSRCINPGRWAKFTKVDTGDRSKNFTFYLRQ
jgi:uncharacterized membrane protein